MSDDNPLNLGATGEFPRGDPIRPDDLGGLRAALTLHRETGTIIMDFGKPVHWLAMSADQAEAWGEALLQAARKVRGHA